jgi:hypothetical protein
MRRKITTFVAAFALTAFAAAPAMAAPPEYPGGQCVKNGVQAVAPGGGLSEYAQQGLVSTIILDHVNDDAEFTEGVLGVEICTFTD